MAKEQQIKVLKGLEAVLKCTGTKTSYEYIYD